jgi:hypothetical protein
MATAKRTKLNDRFYSDRSMAMIYKMLISGKKVKRAVIFAAIKKMGIKFPESRLYWFRWIMKNQFKRTVEYDRAEHTYQLLSKKAKASAKKKTAAVTKKKTTAKKTTVKKTAPKKKKIETEDEELIAVE